MSILTRKIHSTYFFFSVYRIKLFSIPNLKKAFVRFGKSLCPIHIFSLSDFFIAGLQFSPSRPTPVPVFPYSIFEACVHCSLCGDMDIHGNCL